MLVLLWFPVTVLLSMATLVAFSISGSSTGQWWSRVRVGEDPDLIAGTSRAIRSDEWLAQSSWVVSQVSQGLPAVNHVFPGGMDATVFNDLPTKDWSTAFRPHLWGFFISLDQGMALRWWLPAALVLIFAYCFTVSLLPRRGLLAALLALAAFWQPTIQWWFMPVTLLPIAFAFAAMTAVVWCVRADSRLARIVPSVVAGYLAVTMGMSIYAPFIVSGVIAAVAFCAGFIVHAWRAERCSASALARRLAPLALAGVGAGAVMVTWFVTRRGTVDAVLGTVYPGQRLTPTGTVHEAELVNLFSAPFQRSLQLDIVDGFGAGNQSEAAAPILISLFLVPPLLWLLVRRWRLRQGTDWLIAAVLLIQVVVLAYMIVPHWNWLAHVMLLDRSTPGRLRPTFLILAVVATVVLGERLQQSGRRVPWLLSLSGGALAIFSAGYVWRQLSAVGSPAVPSAYAIVTIAVVATAVVLLARRHLTTGAILLVACAAVIGAGVNPIYRGVIDLGRDTAAGRMVSSLSDGDPEARWVGVGSELSLATVVEAGVEGYSGVQTYPSTDMWNQIDPTHRYEDVWNRLAHVRWLAGSGDPSPRIAAADQIELTFDSCSSFAQSHVTYALVDGSPLDQPCAEPVAQFGQDGTRQWIYRVVPSREAS